jgi:hypothetical protein
VNSYLTDAPAPIHHYLFVRPEPSGGYTAGVLGLSEVRAAAGTEGEALQAVMRALEQWLANTRWVQVRVAEPARVHPAAQFAGHAKDDPEFDEYLAEIQRYRREANQRECSDPSSTPTT